MIFNNYNSSFVVAIAAYLLIGVVYNKFVDKQKGWNVIPNYTFWSAVTLAIMVNIIFYLKFQLKVNLIFTEWYDCYMAICNMSKKGT